jgi:putative membrane protein
MGGFAFVMLIISGFVMLMAVVAVFLDQMTARNQLAKIAPETLLAARFAKGEIDEAEYARRLSILRMGPPLQIPE